MIRILVFILKGEIAMIKLEDMRTIYILNKELAALEKEKKELIVKLKRIETEMRLICIAKQAIANENVNDNEID